MYLNSQNLDKLQNALWLDLSAFLPELILCATIILMLLLRLFSRLERRHMGEWALIGTLLALAASWGQWQGTSGMISPENWIAKGSDIFSGLLVYDNFTIFLRLFLYSFTALVIWLSLLTGIPDREDSADFYCLLLGSAVGMSIMASANHLLMVYIGVEMASLPSYALAGFLKGRRQSSEAALKYVVYGGGASGVMLFGISLVAGKFGTGYLPDIALGFAAPFQPPAVSAGLDPVLLLGTLFVLVGLGFKLAAVPFHFWCPDVFEGAAAEVAAFLSVASKGAALALLGRFALVLTGLARGSAADYQSWVEVARVLVPALGFFAALTATFGNLAAYAQTNLKRLLAYSTIAHAGYMMMGLAALTREGAAAVLFYLVAYLFMNLGAFAVVAFLRNQTGSEDLSAYRGLVYRAPFLSVLMAIFLLSLLGMPPLAGFVAKFQIFSVLFNAGKEYQALGLGSMSFTMYALLAVGGLNTALSAVYYIKVLKVMILDRPVEVMEGEPAEPLPIPAYFSFYAAVLAVMLFVFGLAFNPLLEASDKGVNRFQKTPRPVATAQKERP